MMNNTRNQIINALFALLQNASGFNYSSRKIKLWSDTPPEQRPALFLMEHGEQYERVATGQPPKITLECTVFIYTNAIQQEVPPPAASLDDILDAIDKALAPDLISNAQTLNGLCSHCWIEGRIVKTPGDLDGDGIAIIPIRILVPA